MWILGSVLPLPNTRCVLMKLSGNNYWICIFNLNLNLNWFIFEASLIQDGHLSELTLKEPQKPARIQSFLQIMW